MRALIRARRVLDRAHAGLLTILLGAMVLNVLWQIVTRFAVGRPSSFTEELARYLLIWFGLLGASYALRRGQHLSMRALVDVLLRRSRTRAQRTWSMVTAIVVAAFSLAVLIVGGGNLVRLTFALDQSSPALGLPLGSVYLVVPLCGLLMVFDALTFPFLPALEEPEVSD